MAGVHATTTASVTLPRVIGHRGAAAHAPENTLASLHAAAALGVRCVEFDVRLSRDGHPVLFHDPTVDRTTDGTGLVRDLTLGHLQGLDAGGWFDTRFRGQRIPALDDALELLTMLGLAANVEIKPDHGGEAEAARVVAKALSRHRSPWPRIVSSFSVGTMAAMSRFAPVVPRALLVSRVPDDWRTRLARLGCRALHAAARSITRRQVRVVAAAGLSLRCYTVNDEATARKLWSWGVESVFTDDPPALDAPANGR